MGNNGLSSQKKVLGVFTLAMINVSLILNLRGLPMLATYGLSVVSYLVLAALMFFLPAALVSAELATGWPMEGGVHAWTKEAFGNRWAMLVAWLEWLNCIIWLPTALGAMAAIFGYTITPSLSQNRYFIVAVILIVFWGATFSNFRGLELSGKISSAGAIAGVIIPGVVVALVAALWAVTGKPVEVTFSARELLPDLGNTTQLVFFIGVLLMFMGIEVSSAHAAEVRDPRKDYPKAIFTAAIIIVAVFIVGALAVAMIMPSGKIDLLTGVMQAFDKSLDTFGVSWGVPVLGLMMVFGMIAQINSWLIGPAKFMLATAREGNLPPFFQKTNDKGIPVNILFVQALIVTAYSLVYLFLPSVTESYWILTVLATQLYLIVYIAMFMVGLKLRYSHPDTPRAYKVPGGKPGIWFVTGLGILSSLFAFFIGFIPPSDQSGAKGQPVLYVLFLGLGVLAVCSVIFIIQHYKKPSWVSEEPEESGDAGGD